jgi:hypothetical protein
MTKKDKKIKIKIEEKSKGKSQEEIEFEQWSDEKYCLEAVKRNGYALSYVKEKKLFLKILKGGTSNLLSWPLIKSRNN